MTSFSFALAAAARTMIMFITVFEQKGPGVDKKLTEAPVLSYSQVKYLKTDKNIKK